MVKKISQLTICIIMLFGIVGFSALTVSADNPASGTCGENVTWALDDTGTITISGTGEMEDYNNYARYAPWHSNKSSVKKVIINDGVTSIGTCAFYDCTGLTSITIPNSITNIGYLAFRGCTGLTSITIPDSVTNIEWQAFDHCSGLTDVTIGSGVTKIGIGAFEYCIELTSIIIPNSVKIIESCVFSHCYGLASIIVSQGNTVYHSSWNCLIENETKTIIAGCKTSFIPEDGSVASIGDSAFSGCIGLKSIVIPDSVTSIGWEAFRDCTGLTNITIPGSVTSIGLHAFSDCTGLTSLVIPNSVTTIGANAFGHVLNVVYSGDASGTPWGARCVNGYVEGNLVYKDSSKTKLVGCNTIDENIIIPASVDTIGYNAFCDCNSIKTIYLPVNTTRIGNGAFENTSLADVYYEGSTVDKIGISFDDSNSQIIDATWHYNSKVSDMPSNPSNPDNPGNPDNPNPPSTDIPEANIIYGNSADNKKTYDYKTTVTFTAAVPEGGSVQWYVDGSPASNGSTLTVKEKTNDYTVKVVVTDKNGNKTMDEEQITIKHGLFDILIWFFVHLFNPGAYDVKQ